MPLLPCLSDLFLGLLSIGPRTVAPTTISFRIFYSRPLLVRFLPCESPSFLLTTNSLSFDFRCH